MSSSDWGATFGAASLTAMQVYEEVLVPRLFIPWAELLLDSLDLEPGEAVLDVACGPGSVARLAAAAVGAGGRVTGIDLSPAMLSIARAKPVEPGVAPISYEEAPAERLPVPDAGFDAATCQQGLQFFPDKSAALAEIRRALRPGGRVGIAVWTDIEESPLFAALARSIRAVAGDELADRYRDGPWGLPSEAQLRELLEGAGFGDVQLTRQALPMVLEGGPGQLAATLAASAVADELAELSSSDREQLAEAIARNVAGVTVDGTLRSEAVSHVAIAHSP